MFEFFANGCIKLGGNHTESQGGCILGTASEQKIRAFAQPNGTDTIHIESDGFCDFEIEIGDTEPRAEEAETPSAIVRGIMNCFIESGNIFGGFDAKISSDIPSKSGLSSSAAFEVLIGRIISGLFFENSVPALRIAQFGQIAENDYFGKPCELTEQLICALGGTVFADFSDPEMPRYRRIDYDFSESGYSAAIIDCGINRADFYGDCASIEKDMSLAAWNMEHTVLSEAEEAEFFALMPILRQRCPELAVMRALYFFDETRRTREEAEALEKGDFSEFLCLYKESAKSIKTKLFCSLYENESENRLMKAIKTAENILGEKGAVKVLRGFSAAVQAIVPNGAEEEFVCEMEKQGYGVMFVL